MNDRANTLPETEMELRSFALNERLMALNQLAKLDSSLMVPALERLAAETDFMFRRLAVMGLANPPTESAFIILQELDVQLFSHHRSVRQTGVIAYLAYD